MIRATLFAGTAILLTGCTLGATENTPEPTEPSPAQSTQAAYMGVYAGTYVCSGGENGITVSIDELEDVNAAKMDVTQAKARLWFYDTSGNPGHPTGAFHLSGLINSGSIDMTPGDWISDVPANWGAAGIKGQFQTENGQIYLHGKPSGPGTSACQDFKLKRLEDF